MRLNKNDVICGLPAADARQAMRLFGEPTTARALGKLVDDVDTLAADLEREGWIQRTCEEGGEVWWETTIRGNALAQASFRRPISRATADGHLKDVIRRAEMYNAETKHLYDIAELVVFGSFLDPQASQLGDLDVALVTRERPTPATSQLTRSQRLLNYADASGRRFNSFTDRLFWAETEVVHILRNRAAAISITRNNPSDFTERWKVVYSYPAP